MYIFPTQLKLIFSFFLKFVNLKELIMSPNIHSLNSCIGIVTKFVTNHLQHQVTMHIMKNIFIAHTIYLKLIFPSIQ